jgi:hypothetical protein
MENSDSPEGKGAGLGVISAFVIGVIVLVIILKLIID